MDERVGMALPGSGLHYLRDGSGAAFNSPAGFRAPPNPGCVHPVQSNFRPASPVGYSPFNVEGSPATVPPPHPFPVAVAASSGGGSLAGSGLIRKKRGRPRKYKPEGSAAAAAAASDGVALGLSSPSSSAPPEKRKRGRPPGSGRKQRLASVGGWMSSSAGVAFTPHVIYVAAGEDIASKILSFSQRRPRALCIMSGSGGVSAVTLHRPASSVGNVTYEGRFEILCLSGSYLVAETDGAQSRTGGVNVSLLSGDGQVIGGSVAGRLIASRPVQVVVCSFVYGGQKPPTPKTKTDTDSKGKKSSGDGTALGQGNVGWPDSKALEGRNPDTDIDLMRG